jgi:hypothetical protein
MKTKTNSAVFSTSFYDDLDKCKLVIYLLAVEAMRVISVHSNLKETGHYVSLLSSDSRSDWVHVD